MTTRFRTQAAAAILLLPLGLAMVAEPAAAQQRGTVVAQANLIDRFVLRPAGRLHAGQEVRFRLHGAPGAQAWVDVPGVINGVDLVESRPGVYEGTYVIRRRDNLDAFASSVATLQSGQQRASARVDVRGNDRNDRDDRFGRDERPPQISDVTPAQGERIAERGRVRISARLQDEGRAGVDPASVALRLNGRDVTRDARVTEDEVQYRADLAPGRYTAELALRDRAGNVARRSWSFDVVDDPRQATRPPEVRPAVIPLHVTSHRAEMVLDPSRPVVVHGRTAAHASVRVQLQVMAVNGAMQVVEQTARADASGNFSAQLPPMQLQQQMLARVGMIISSTLADGTTVEQRLSLRPA